MSRRRTTQVITRHFGRWLQTKRKENGTLAAMALAAMALAAMALAAMAKDSFT